MDLLLAPPDGPVGPDQLVEIARCVAEHPTTAAPAVLLHRVPTDAVEQLRPQGFQGDPTGLPPSRPDPASSAMS